MTVEPTGNFAEHVLLGQLIAPLSVTTVPLLVRPIDSVTNVVLALAVVVVDVVEVVVVVAAVVVVDVEAVKVAPTFRCASTATVQVDDVPEHAPVQPVNLLPPLVDATSVVVAPDV